MCHDQVNKVSGSLYEGLNDIDECAEFMIKNADFSMSSIPVFNDNQKTPILFYAFRKQVHYIEEGDISNIDEKHGGARRRTTITDQQHKDHSYMT